MCLVRALCFFRRLTTVHPCETRRDPMRLSSERIEKEEGIDIHIDQRWKTQGRGGGLPPLRTMCAKHRPQKDNRGGGLGMRRSYEYTFKRLMIIASCILAMELSEKTPACLIGMASWRLRLTALTYRSSAQHSKKIRRISRRLLLPGAASC